MNFVVAYYAPERSNQRWAIGAAVIAGVASYLGLVDGRNVAPEEVHIELVESGENSLGVDVFLDIQAEHTDRRQRHLDRLPGHVYSTLSDSLVGLQMGMRFQLVRGAVWGFPGR
jgi:hypothetical protein